jgi:hypothetical protein
LLVEVDVVNSTGLLFPGAFTQIHFKIKSNNPTLLIPSASLIFRAKGLRVAVLGDGNRARLLPVALGRDFGNTVEVITGLTENASIIANPPDSLVDGEVVRVVSSKAAQEVEE